MSLYNTHIREKGREIMKNKLYKDITKDIKRYSNNLKEDMRKYIQNKEELHSNNGMIDYYMTEISEAIGKKNWFYIYDIMEDNLFFEYIQRDYIHKKLTEYIEEFGTDAFIHNLKANIIEKGLKNSYVFVLDFLWRN